MDTYLLDRIAYTEYFVLVVQNIRVFEKKLKQ